MSYEVISSSAPTHIFFTGTSVLGKVKWQGTYVRYDIKDDEDLLRS